MNTKQLLNWLVDNKVTAHVKGQGGWATIFRWQELDYVFEIGKNCGTVFSEAIVESVKLENGKAGITLKR